MHRVTALSILTPILGAGGAGCLGGAAAWSGAAGPWVWVGAGLLVAAAGAAAAGALLARRQYNRLAERLTDMVRAERITSIPPADLAGGSARLVQAADEFVRYAESALSDAALKAKDLEIQLKVATAERQHAEAILYSISDAVLVTDTFDELVLANEPAAKALDFDLEQAHRRRVDQILHDPKMVSLIREMRQTDGRGGRRVVEHRVRTPAGVRTFRITLSTTADGGAGEAASGGASGAPAGVTTAGASSVVAVLHDVTHEKEVSEMKNDFVSSVSHELRTPLASIKAYVELLIDGEAQDEKTKREFYEVIQNEANRLGRMIDNILNISRIESGLVKLDKKPLDLTAVVKDAVDVMAPQAEQKGIRLAVRLAGGGARTHADRDMLCQAVLNVLGNAVKYTPVGGEVTVETARDEGRRKVVLRVTDTGVGIPPEELPHVFDKFYRAESNSRMAPGTGLGLSLVKHIVETVHQGRAFALSEVGKGSTFGFELDVSE